MRRILALAVLVALGLWGGCKLWRSLAGDEDKIRWMIEDAVDDFNAGRPGSAVAPLADDWMDRTIGIHRDTLHSALVGLMLQERGARPGELPWRLEAPAEELRIVVGDDDTATAALELRLSRRHGEEWAEEWRIAVDAELRDGDDGWKIRRSSHETLEGRRP